MLNTKKLLYILPDVAYVAELLPAKKEHTFAIQSFRQINGEFLDDENLIADHIEKLISKIEPESYHLILPDFLFTNTIVEVKETQESKVKNYIKDQLLPSLDLTKETHEIETFILTQYGGVSKVQITALERSAIDPIVISAKEHGVEISDISPLSWTIKSIVSLEPSLTLIQIGSMLHLAEHYIGVDQCTTTKVDELENVVETIKTLKGGQPSIQTMYLLTNELVEEKLKEQISSTLPIQQLASFKEDETQMPSYVKQIIESGMKTLDIPEYPVPKFALPKNPSGLAPITKVKDETEEEELEEKEVVGKAEASPEIEDLQAPTPPADITDDDVEEEEEVEETKPVGGLTTEIVTEPLALPVVVPPPALPTPSVIELAAPSTPELAATVETAVISSQIDAVDTKEDEAKEEETKPEPEIKPEISHVITPDEPDGTEEKSTVTEKTETSSEPNLGQFAPSNSASSAASAKLSTTQSANSPVIIKNKSGTGAMLRMVFITLAVFCATVAIGVGIGLGVLSLTNKDDSGQVQSPVSTPSPVVQTSPSPVVSPSPSASPAAALNKSKTAVLVVNATTTAGYAGTTKGKLETAGYKPVKAANAKGKYEPGFYVLMKTEDPALVAELAKDTGLALEFATGYATEDSAGANQAVIVLAK